MRNFSASSIGRVGADRLGAAHHVDRVDVELAGHARGLLVLAEREHADAGDQHDRRVGAAHRGAVRRRVALVVGGVVRAVGGVQLAQPRDDVLHRRVGRQVDDQRLDLGAQEVVRARRAQLGQRRQPLRAREVQDDVGVGEVADLRPVRARQTADHRGERGGLGAALGLGQRLRPGDDGAERVLALAASSASWRRCTPRPSAMISSDRASASSLVSPHAVMPCPPRTQPMACGLAALIAAMSRPSWKPGRRHGHPRDGVAEDLAGERLAVGGGGDRDAGVGVQVVHVRRVDQAVHGRVDRRRRAALAVQAVVERGDHLVLAVDARVHVDQRAQPVQAQHGQVRRLERPQVAAGALDPQQLDRLAGDRVGLGALGGGVARRRSWCCAGPRPSRLERAMRSWPPRSACVLALVVGRASSCRSSVQAPHPACVPPTRSATIFSA